MALSDNNDTKEFSRFYPSFNPGSTGDQDAINDYEGLLEDDVI